MTKQPNELSRRLHSFRYALAGWRYAWRTQPNVWIHGLVTVLVVLAAFWLRLPRRDWAILVLAMMIVWLGELFNTAVEAIVDLAMPEPHPLAQVAKDVSAGAVLLAALGAVVVGALILGPPLAARLWGG